MCIICKEDIKLNDFKSATSSYPHIPVAERSKERLCGDRLLGLRVQIPPEVCMSFCCQYCVLSWRGLCDGPISHPEESDQLWCVIVRDLETSRMRRPWPALGCCATGKRICLYLILKIKHKVFIIQDRQCTYNVTAFANQYCRKKAINTITGLRACVRVDTRARGRVRARACM
jgi:hypothetical protein